MITRDTLLYFVYCGFKCDGFVMLPNDGDFMVMGVWFVYIDAVKKKLLFLILLLRVAMIQWFLQYLWRSIGS